MAGEERIESQPEQNAGVKRAGDLLIAPPSDGIESWEARVNADARREKGLLPGVKPTGGGHQSS